MYLPTFWKLSAEVYMYKACKVAGWGLPAAAMSKSLYTNVISIKSISPRHSLLHIIASAPLCSH